jgi:hypothetical protein
MENMEYNGVLLDAQSFVLCPTSSVRLQRTKEGHFLTKFDGTGMK